jgi:hypothetical protein
MCIILSNITTYIRYDFEPKFKPAGQIYRLETANPNRTANRFKPNNQTVMPDLGVSRVTQIGAQA